MNNGNQGGDAQQGGSEGGSSAEGGEGSGQDSGNSSASKQSGQNGGKQPQSGGEAGEGDPAGGESQGNPSGAPNSSNSGEGGAAERSTKPEHDGDVFDKLLDRLKDDPRNPKNPKNNNAQGKPAGERPAGDQRPQDGKAEQGESRPPQAGEQGSNSPSGSNNQQSSGQPQGNQQNNGGSKGSLKKVRASLKSRARTARTVPAKKQSSSRRLRPMQSPETPRTKELGNPPKINQASQTVPKHSNRPKPKTKERPKSPVKKVRERARSRSPTWKKRSTAMAISKTPIQAKGGRRSAIAVFPPTIRKAKEANQASRKIPALGTTASRVKGRTARARKVRRTIKTISSAKIVLRLVPLITATEKKGKPARQATARSLPIPREANRGNKTAVAKKGPANRLGEPGTAVPGRTALPIKAPEKRMNKGKGKPALRVALRRKRSKRPVSPRAINRVKEPNPASRQAAKR